jgi:NAD(P)-dependent dehydrogenase (short-subunit alcohol dehydrogenase family)
MSFASPISSPLPVVLVTGAARRLGREMALALAKAGWRVAVHYRDSVDDAMKTVAACAEYTSGSAVFCADLADENAVRSLLPAVVQSMGQVDAVVNSASTYLNFFIKKFCRMYPVNSKNTLEYCNYE